MNKQEMKAKFDEIYNMIVSSNNVKAMNVLGNVFKQQMDWFIENKPEAAEEWIEQLCSVKWHNYLTRKETAAIIAEMDPKPLWSQSQWETEMLRAELPLEHAPYYNKCALFVTMCMICSDSGPTLSKIMGDAEHSSLFKPIYYLAIDKLLDKDGRFCIRKYFDLIQ